MSHTITSLQREINDCKYELFLIESKVKPRRGVRLLTKRIEVLRTTIREMKASKKKAK